MPKFTSTTKPVGAFALAAALTCAGGALAQDTLKVGVVGFLTGAAAGPFGIPARDAAELMIEAINNGTVPAPYDSAGIGGLSVDPIYVDEAGGSATQVTELRKLVQQQGADAVVGYISSGSCLAVAPVADELQVLGSGCIDFGCTAWFTAPKMEL